MVFICYVLWSLLGSLGFMFLVGLMFLPLLLIIHYVILPLRRVLERHQRLLKYGVRTTAYIVKAGDSTFLGHSVEYNFLTPDGQKVIGKGSAFVGFGEEGEQGSQCPVFYDPANPQDHVLECSTVYQVAEDVGPQPEQQPFDAPSDAVVIAPAVPIRLGRLNTNIGIETVGGGFTTILHKETTLPCFQTVCLSTAHDFRPVQDNQDKFRLHLVYKESPKVAACQSLAYIEISGIPVVPLLIDILFQVSAKGALTLRARDLAGKAQIRLDQIKNLKT